MQSNHLFSRILKQSAMSSSDTMAQNRFSSHLMMDHFPLSRTAKTVRIQTKEKIIDVSIDRIKLAYFLAESRQDCAWNINSTARRKREPSKTISKNNSIRKTCSISWLLPDSTLIVGFPLAGSAVAVSSPLRALRYARLQHARLIARVFDNSRAATSLATIFTPLKINRN